MHFGPVFPDREKLACLAIFLFVGGKKMIKFLEREKSARNSNFFSQGEIFELVIFLFVRWEKTVKFLETEELAAEREKLASLAIFLFA